MVTAAAVLAKLPRPLKRAVMDAAREAKSPAQRMLLRMAGMRSRPYPAAPSESTRATRVYIAPANYAAQGYAWARALESTGDVAGWNMEVRQPGGFAFPADRVVGLGPFHLSRDWQRAEFEAVSSRTHVLVEAARSMFGRLFDYDVLAEIRALQARGVSVAMVSHGTDTRNPGTQRALTPWSPFHEDLPDVERLQAIAHRNRELMSAAGVPLFAVTPDLLEDLPGATWCPNVVDVELWRAAAQPLLRGSTPVALHVPTNGWFKGTTLIEPTLRSLADAGLIEYRARQGLAPEEMRAEVGTADIVLEQFRMGLYSTTAVESMAAGRVVVGHVAPAVRDRIHQETGREVPIVEATPDILDAVLRELIRDHDRMRHLAEAGISYVRAVHSGEMSARVLRENWIDATAP